MFCYQAASNPGWIGVSIAPSASSAVPPRASSRSSARPEPVAGRAHFAGFLAVERDERAGCGGGAVDPHRKQPLLDQAAIFGAGGQFLADIAALLPIDAVQLVEPRFEQDRFFRHQIAAAVGNAEREAVAVVGGEIGSRRSRIRQGGQDARGPG